jgi:hypothetical protein
MRKLFASFLVIAALGSLGYALVLKNDFTAGAADRVRVSFAALHAKGQLETDRLEIETARLDMDVAEHKGKRPDPRKLLIAQKALQADELAAVDAAQAADDEEKEPLTAELTWLFVGLALAISALVLFVAVRPAAASAQLRYLPRRRAVGKSIL